MKISLEIIVHDNGTVETLSSAELIGRKHDLNASVIVIGALEIVKNAILTDRFKCVDLKKANGE